MLFPYTESRKIELSPAAADDAAQAYEILFRLGAPGLPMIDEFAENFGAGLSACFLVRRKDTEEVIGLSTLSKLHAAGHLHLEVHLAAEAADEFAGEVHALTANFAFAMWRTRKVYLHLPTDDASGTGFGDAAKALLRPEAVLPDHAYFHGRLWDIHILAVHRDDWNTHGVDLLKQIV
ncbi:GNAT family protein [Streptomyces salinarius]|uniref:GNAT family protein n=1 Tax=Streptomyces salinarius TaxID=2762598 RepID=UPI0013DC3CDF|nr:GNAT family protein [Streptomyces salinarius]